MWNLIYSREISSVHFENRATNHCSFFKNKDGVAILLHDTEIVIRANRLYRL